MSALHFQQSADQYELLEVLGEGVYGEVVKARRKDTGEIVAVKKPLFQHRSNRMEIFILEKLMCLNFDQHNIVKFYGWFPYEKLGKALVLEMLDMSLWDYFKLCRFQPLPLSDIRDIVQQMATALCALQSIEVIHGDLKASNIMVADHQMKPLKLKLADFGLALLRSRAELGMCVQTPGYMAPEIIVGLPFTEAIDIFSLGYLMSILMCKISMFDIANQKDYYFNLLCMVKLMGQPRQDLLNVGKHTKKYFTYTQYSKWIFKTPKIFCGKDFTIKFVGYDTLRDLRQELVGILDVEEWEQCIELLKAILIMNGDERITPSQVLVHPFITRSPSPTTSPSNVLMDQPVKPANCVQPEDRFQTAEDVSITARELLRDSDRTSPLTDGLFVLVNCDSFEPPDTPVRDQNLWEKNKEEEEKKKKKKKKKKKQNIFWRFFSRMKKYFFS